MSVDIAFAAAIKKIAPGAKPALVNAIVRNWPLAQAKAGLTTKNRICHFLSETATETSGFKAIDENLRYSAKRLTQVWPARFPTIKAATPYANNPEKLANKTYGGRLGNNKSGDGWKYRGGGFIQTTGKYNYTKAGFADNPEALRDPDLGFQAALTFWIDNKCNQLADKDDILALRKRINGGTNGLDEAVDYLAKAKKFITPKLVADLLLMAQPAPQPAPDPAVVEVVLPPPAPAPDPKAEIEKLEGAMPPHVLRGLQLRFRELNYFEVGMVDVGLWGQKMSDATLAFQRYEQLEAQTGHLNKETLERLKIAQPRPVSQERAELTLDDLRAKGEKIVKHADPIKTVAKWGLGGTGFLWTIVTGVGQFFEGVWEELAPVRAVFDGIPLFVWGLIAIAVAFYVYRKVTKIETYHLDDIHSGRHAGPGTLIESEARDVRT